ncbi:hypothetical protein CI238_04511 [Colletotrichum incanum]|uniref:Glycoside hydrolase n=1 Tax=Colletotrichum incanum TaxID=1573173 RepID=A0A167CY50_COLIC|nr:hypothetical protein CI238_04511 [Colletotrichum incanum]
MAQLPTEAAGAAAGVLMYSCISEICSLLMLWLTWSHHEQFTYVACVAYFTLLSTTASIIQQIHDIITWRDMLREQFNNKRLNPNNPEQAIANGSVGVDLVLYYIQYYCYNVEAMFVMFWAIALAQSVYKLNERGKLKRLLNRLNAAGKIIAVLFPLCTILSLRIPALQDQFIPFILVADLPLMLSLAVGCGTMLAILIRYVQSRRKLTTFNASYGDSSQSGARHTETTASFSTGKAHPPRRSVYDRWLMGRFTIAFLALSIFEVTNTLFQLSSINNNKKDAALTEPDFSLERAKATFALFLPGVTPGIFLFIIFGTTKTCRTLMVETFTLRRWRKLREEKRNKAKADSVGLRNVRKALPPLPKIHWVDEYQSESVRMGAPRSKNASESNLSDEGPILPIMKNDRIHHPGEEHKSPWKSPASWRNEARPF